MQLLVIAKAAIFNEQGQVLILTRSSNDPYRPGGPDFPGGHIEPGEELAAGTARELLEEAGLTIASSKLRLIYAATEAYEDRSVTRLLFWGYIRNPEVRLSSEHDAYKWIEPEKVRQAFPHPFYGAGFDYGMKHQLYELKPDMF